VIIEVQEVRQSPYHLLSDLAAATKAFDEAAQNGTLSTERDAAGRLVADRLATLRSVAGDTSGAISAFDKRWKGLEGPPLSTEALSSLVAVDAISTIVNEARSRNIVILNEIHHVPLHRAFAMRLARELREIGYEYLACETLSESHGLERGFPSRTDGVYSAEPVYGEFLRDALRLGWKPVAYDDFQPEKSLSQRDFLAWRERKQAEHLVERIFKNNPNAKVLVFVGGLHGDKRMNGNAGGVRQMGAHLRELTGTEPLSIDQTTFYEHPDPSMEKKAYGQLLATLDIGSPSIVKTKTGAYFQFGVPANAVDMQVVHPRYGVTHGRPAWLATLAGRNPIPVPDALLTDRKPKLIYAYYSNEFIAAPVPIDSVMLRPDGVVPALMLPPGRYRLEYEE
jgi:hypothetical protein